jgi:hypothetical protein
MLTPGHIGETKLAEDPRTTYRKNPHRAREHTTSNYDYQSRVELDHY